VVAGGGVWATAGRILSALAVIGGALCGAPSAQALRLGSPWGQPASLDSTWTTLLHYHADNDNALDDDDQYGDLRSIYELRGRLGDHTLSLRAEALHFFAPPSGAAIQDAGAADYADEYTVEKLSYSYRSGALTLAAGDQYLTFGRGLALSLRRVDDLGQDTTLRGAYARWRGRLLRATIAGGWTNAANLDPVNERLRFASCAPTMPGGQSCNPFAIDPSDRLAAARLEGRWPGRVHVALHEVVLQREGEDEWTAVHGAALEVPRLPGDLGDVYGEVAMLQRPEEGADDGLGAYGALNTYLGPATITLEGKHYEHFLLQTKLPVDSTRFSPDRTVLYHEPPSLEPSTLIPYDNISATGGRLRTKVRVDPTHSVLEASGAYFLTGTDEGSVSSQRVVRHVYGSVEQDLPGGAHLTAGGGRRWDLPDEGRAVERRLWHTEGKLVVPVHGPHAANLGWTVLFWDLVRPGAEEGAGYKQGDIILGYSWAPKLSLSLVMGFDDEFTERTNPSILKEEQEKYRAGLPADPDRALQEIRTVFLAGEVTLHVADWIVVQALAGSLRGGPKCIGSVCRVYPPFTGARAEVTLRY